MACDVEEDGRLLINDEEILSSPPPTTMTTTLDSDDDDGSSNHGRCCLLLLLSSMFVRVILLISNKKEKCQCEFKARTGGKNNGNNDGGTVNLYSHRANRLHGCLTSVRVNHQAAAPATRERCCRGSHR